MSGSAGHHGTNESLLEINCEYTGIRTEAVENILVTPFFQC